MNEHLRDRILRKLETLSDERGYQVLDFAEFLESRYAERASPSANTFTKFTEAIEDKLRAGRVSASAIAETVGFMNRAAAVLNNAVETGRTMATDIVNTARATTESKTSASDAKGESKTEPKTPPSTPNNTSSTAHETQQPGAPGEKL
jgi:hypothetical protein